jgi:Arc/MetJ family transcription regulator
VRQDPREDQSVYTLKVYHRCMTRTNIDIDDELVADVIRRYGLSSKREAVDLALRRLAGPKITPEFALSLEGIGWEGDLDEIRRQNVVEW